MIVRFALSEASAYVVRNRLKGPYEDGSGAPFLAVMLADNSRYEHMLVNSLGPVEMWAFSTTPLDVALRSRLYSRVGPGEARKRLARVFPTGTAKREIERRKDERLRHGEDDDHAQEGVIEELVYELADGTGLGIVLRSFTPEPEVKESNSLRAEPSEPVQEPLAEAAD
jgi:intracellular multiplication protein IcmB